MRIQHNIPAMNAYRNYNINTSAVNKNLEKLSSGYKIAVEVGGVGDTVDFGLELINFLLEVGAVYLVVVGAVGGLGSQVDHAVEHVLEYKQEYPRSGKSGQWTGTTILPSSVCGG